MAFLLPSDKKVPLPVEWLDKAGNPTTIDTTTKLPTWASSDETIVTVADVADDGLSCRAVAVGPTGTAQVSCRADAARGAPEREVIATVDIEVVPAEAVSGSISPGAVEDK